MELAPETLRKLELYPWPGNIRELQHAIERAGIMSDGRILQPSDFLLSPSEAPALPNETPDNFNLEEVEKNALREAILKHNGNLSRAARELG